MFKFDNANIERIVIRTRDISYVAGLNVITIKNTFASRDSFMVVLRADDNRRPSVVRRLTFKSQWFK